MEGVFSYGERTRWLWLVPFGFRPRASLLLRFAYRREPLSTRTVILQGRQPIGLTATRLTELDLPLDWAEQHRLLVS